jgi:hypothetical protein
VLREYLWAGLPVVTTAGSALATTIDATGAGATVPAGDLDALVAVLESLISDDVGRRAMARSASALGEESRWSVVAAPLNKFCREARRTPDALSPADADRAAIERGAVWRWGGVRQDLRIVSALLKEGGPRLAVTQALTRVRRLRGGT